MKSRLLITVIITMVLFYLPSVFGSILTKKGEANKKAL